MHLLSHSGFNVSAKSNVNIFWRRKCSVSSEQVSVSRLYPFGLQEAEAALTRPFCPAPPPSCPGGVGSKSTLAACTHTHTAGLHTRICTCIHKCCPGVCVRCWLKYVNNSITAAALLLQQCVSCSVSHSRERIFLKDWNCFCHYLKFLVRTVKNYTQSPPHTPLTLH